MAAVVATGGVILGTVHLSAGGAELAPSDCERTSRELFGAAPVRFGGSGPKPTVPEPKKVRNAKAQLPAQWPKHCPGTVAVHEALIGLSGKVERVWTLKAPCAEVDKAIAAAVRQWEYAPTVVNETPSAVCMVVSTFVHLR
jgi:hypothetical protein